MQNENIIKKPIITEKSLRDAKHGIFTFEVNKESAKAEIKKAINKMFNVHVVAITSMIAKGKKRLSGRKKIPIYQSDIKKVRVKLKSGEKIDLFEVGEKK